MGDEEDESNMTETQRAIAAARRKAKEEEEVWFEEYMAEVAERRQREEEELEELRQRIEERRIERQEEEEKRQEYAQLAAERYKQEEEDRKAKHEEAKRKKQFEREKKQAMMAGGMMPVQTAPKKRTFTSKKKADGEEGDAEEEAQEAVKGKGEAEHAANKAAFMAKYAEPLGGLDDMDVFGLRTRIKALHAELVAFEMAKYDLECRAKVQSMDFNELQERQKQQLRKKAMKQGLDPEAFAAAKHPQKVKTQNAYDRVIDARSFTDRKEYYLKTPPPPKAVAHGSGRPPVEWGRTYKTEEIQNVRKHLEENPPKYQELEPVEGAKPPVPVVPMQVPAEDEPAPVPPPAADPEPQAEEEVAAE